jgi:hypothetical protein
MEAEIREREGGRKMALTESLHAEIIERWRASAVCVTSKLLLLVDTGHTRGSKSGRVSIGWFRLVSLLDFDVGDETR